MSKEEELKILEEKCKSEIKDELSKQANNLVFGKGNCDAKICL